MASRAASKLLMPTGRLCSDGLKRLVGAGKGPLARTQAQFNSSAPIEKNNDELGPFVKLVDHEKSIVDLESKYDRVLSDLKQGFDSELVVLRYDLKKEADERSLKHYLKVINVKNDVKALEGRIEARLTTHELKTELQLSKDETKRYKTYGWFFGASTAFLSRFSKIPDLIFKRPKGDL